jgi:hypothetical protein
MIDGPGTIGFDAAAILMVPGITAWRSTFDRGGDLLPFGFCCVHIHRYYLPSAVPIAHSAHQPLPRKLLPFVASLIGLLNAPSGLGGAFSCFGFLISRLLRFCPLAMAKRPFNESCAFA